MRTQKHCNASNTIDLVKIAKVMGFTVYFKKALF